MDWSKMLLPGFLLVFQVIFIILYGLLVRYDDTGAPITSNDTTVQDISELGSSRSALKVYPLFQDVHVMIFVGFGFLMTFLRRYGFGSISFNLLLASFAIQWSTLTSGVFQFIDQSDDGDCCTINVNLETLVGADFAGAAVLITMGAVLGKASPLQLVVIAFFELIFYSCNEALNVHVYMAADIGGSMLIHTFGAYFGLAVSLVLYNKDVKDHEKNSSVYHSDLFSMIGTLFLWLFWPSFNGVLASGNAQTRAVINTYYAMTASVLGTFIFSLLFNRKKGKLSMVHVQNATLAGGVAVGAMADMVIQPWAALVIGLLAGLISVFGYKFLSPLLEKYLYIQDTCGVHNLHGMPGVFAGLGSFVAAALASYSGGGNKVQYGDSLYVVFPARAPSSEGELTLAQAGLGVGTGDGRSAGEQAGYQLACLATTLAIAIIGGLITGAIVRFLPKLKGEDDVDEDHLFDDEICWELPDDADNYLPSKSTKIEERVEAIGLRHRGVSPQMSADPGQPSKEQETSI
ncbi:Ammonium transporter Rh type B-B [Geodia barretti]|uniref:Ammonium transporter Rh type B-B n=1 Tax=Geodia barretti TaxID=519541 RepID=A0AA35ST93_GEOBA|nr:Ammonium transporter Rh type B-B [Geodia barretti]